MSGFVTAFPLFATAYDLTAAGSPTIMLDGMEVLFDKTAGFYPVRIEPKPEAAQNGQAKNGKSGNGRPRSG
jgi:hypothetical protein